MLYTRLNQKSERIIAIAEDIIDEYGAAESSDRFVREGDPETVHETAGNERRRAENSRLCAPVRRRSKRRLFRRHALHRLARRMGPTPADADHEEVRGALESAVPAQKCGFDLTAMIQIGREYCSARESGRLDHPDACPMADLCEQIGVYPAAGEVLDPAEAPEVDRE